MGPDVGAVIVISRLPAIRLYEEKAAALLTNAN
jgi:hypothetical protein